MMQVRWGLSEEKWQQIFAEWSCAVAHATKEIQQKCLFWSKLPWSLCALAVPDETEAREHGKFCMAQYDAAVAAADETSMHRVAIKFLSPHGVLRGLLEQWINGAHLVDPPLRHLLDEIAKLSNIPVVERVIESRASDVNHALQHNRSGL
eukprot:11190565-Lingulodinium_polyedra.AAC.2